MATQEVTRPPAPANDVMPIHGIDHLELYVGNAAQAAYYYTRAFGFTYTRYADDLTFSSDRPEAVKVLRQRATAIVGEEGFAVNEAKTRVARKGRCQRVTGVVVNTQLGLSRQERRRLRAMIHQLRPALEAGTADPARVEGYQAVAGPFGFVAGFSFNVPPGKPSGLKTPADRLASMPGVVCGRPLRGLMAETLRAWAARTDPGRFVLIGGAAGASAKPIISLDGTPPKRITVQAWDSADALNKWYNSADYQSALKIGKQYATFRRYAVEGQ